MLKGLIYRYRELVSEVEEEQDTKRRERHLQEPRVESKGPATSLALTTLSRSLPGSLVERPPSPCMSPAAPPGQPLLGPLGPSLPPAAPWQSASTTGLALAWDTYLYSSSLPLLVFSLPLLSRGTDMRRQGYSNERVWTRDAHSLCPWPC